MVKPERIKEILQQTLDDRRLSRSERTALDQILAHIGPSRQKLGMYRAMAFDLARETLDDPNGKATVEWLEDVVKLLRKQGPKTPKSDLAEAHFSPGDDGRRRITGLLSGARKSIDICVFTITDDRISKAILEAHQRGCQVRIITDNDKANDRGSDIDRLEKAGIPVRVDRTHYHMHHKFALFDRNKLLTGSYNWTRSAATSNQENFIVTDDARLLGPFAELFDKLWDVFA